MPAAQMKGDWAICTEVRGSISNYVENRVAHTAYKVCGERYELHWSTTGLNGGSQRCPFSVVRPADAPRVRMEISCATLSPKRK